MNFSVITELFFFFFARWDTKEKIYVILDMG